MSNKKTEVLETIRNHIAQANLTEEDKSSSYRHIEEWYAEDKAFEHFMKCWQKCHRR